MLAVVLVPEAYRPPAQHLRHLETLAQSIRPRKSVPLMFAFFSSRLGCLGSIVVSIIGTLILMALMSLF